MIKRKSFILTLCMALVTYLCLSFSGGTMTVDAAGKTDIDTLSVAF